MELQEAYQEDLGIDCAETDESLECQGECQKEVNTRITIFLQEEISTEKDGETGEKYKPEECESSVLPDLSKEDAHGKDVPKASLVDRLRSHLKSHRKTTKKGQDQGSNLTIETTDYIPITQETSGPNQEQQSENVNLPNTLACVDENKSASPIKLANPIKISPVTKSVSDIKQVKRKNCPKADQMTPAKPVKKRRLKKGGASSENILSRGNLSPMRNKLINSNALLSCVRKGLMKKSFLCKFCRKEFVKKKDIEEHIQVHVGKKPFQCNICHRRFSRTMELSRHLKRHNAEKKYQCTSCGKAFIEYNNLKRHTYIHTGEKPYSCPHCPKAFTQSGHMRTHIKNHHKDIQC
uniref:C2H2-type domain-containing protein n=1 Tax=Periophthalmus magnuspinnatus TaxID=409849 RepID=A0A3B3ZVQ0_9GOBI